MSGASEMLTDYDEGKKLATIALGRIKRDDIVHRGFLKPLEIGLKIHQSEATNINLQRLALHQQFFVNDDENLSAMMPNSLPSGLRIAVKNSICDNRYALKDIVILEEHTSYESLKENNQDNILSLMKTKEGLELAICVCMYSEDKKMLRNTLAGISENISNLIVHEGVEPDKIGVFVIMDGIEKVDSSVVEYFSELQRSNNINLGENLPPSLTIDEISRRASYKTQEEINQEEFKNVNNFLFNVAELQDRNQRSFPSVKAEYQEIKELLNTIQVLKKKKTLFDDLPSKVRPFFFQEARQQKKKLTNMAEREVGWITEDRLIEEFALDIRKVRPIIIKALQQCERYCKEYLQSREDLAYLACFKNKIKLYVPEEEEQSQQDEETVMKSSLIAEGTDRKLAEEIPQQGLKTSMNLFLCVKYKNSGKLSSHNWFFNGFCKELKPKYSVLLDVGLKPDGHALHKMYKHMKSNDQIGGVCGYMSLKIEQLEQEEEAKLDDVDCLSKICLKFADIQRTQQVEYHFAHLMDKAFESSFGFIHVLPGAFSAYNMAAIIDYNSTKDDQLLRSYFKSIDEKLANSRVVHSEINLETILLKVLLPDMINRWFIDTHPESEEQMLYNENIYLAEDRILCMGIHKKGFEIKFLPDAYAEVDPIKTVHGLLGQRKRWINGSFFAFEKVKKELEHHQQKIGYEICLNIQILYLTLMNSLAYFAPSFFLFTVHIAMDSFRADILTTVFSGIIGDAKNSEILNSFVYTIDFIYVMLICSIIYYSLHLTNGNKHFKPYIYVVSTIFGIFAISVFIVLAVDVFRGLIDNTTFLLQNQSLIATIPGGLDTINSMRWILIITTLIYTIPILVYVTLYRKFHILFEILLGAFSFLFYGPTYLNILNIYSLCRIDDISWGTKGLDATASTKNQDLRNKWYLFKMIHVGKFILWNVVLSAVLLLVGAGYQPRFFITMIMVSIIAFTLCFKIVIALLYMTAYKISSCCEDPPQEKHHDLKFGVHSRIDHIFNLYRENILEEVKGHLMLLAHKYNNNNYKENPRSFMQLSRSPSHVGKSFRKLKEEFYSRSQLSQQLSMVQGLTEKRESNNFVIRALNEFNLPIQTKNILDQLSQYDKKQSLMSIDRRNSQFSLDKRTSFENMDKRTSQFSLDKRNSQNSLEKKSSLEKKNSPEPLEKRNSKAELEKKKSVSEIHEEEQEENMKIMDQEKFVNLFEGEKPETIGQENSSEEQSMQNLKPEVIKIRPKLKKPNEIALPSRFKPEDK